MIDTVICALILGVLYHGTSMLGYIVVYITGQSIMQSKEIQKKIRNQRILKGLCVRCGAPSIHYRCNDCAVKHAEFTAHTRSVNSEKKDKVMSEVWKPEPIEVYQSWIDQCHQQSTELTAWELDFCDSLQERLDRKVNLSERQVEILEKIYSEKTK